MPDKLDDILYKVGEKLGLPSYVPEGFSVEVRPEDIDYRPEVSRRQFLAGAATGGGALVGGKFFASGTATSSTYPRPEMMALLLQCGGTDFGLTTKAAMEYLILQHYDLYPRDGVVGNVPVNILTAHLLNFERDVAYKPNPTLPKDTYVLLLGDAAIWSNIGIKSIKGKIQVAGSTCDTINNPSMYDPTSVVIPLSNLEKILFDGKTVGYVIYEGDFPLLSGAKPYRESGRIEQLLLEVALQDGTKYELNWHLEWMSCVVSPQPSKEQEEEPTPGEGEKPSRDGGDPEPNPPGDPTQDGESPPPGRNGG